MRATVDVVIVNWNTRHYLRDCLSSVFANTSSATLDQVVVVDNASVDDSLDRAQELFARENTTLIANEDNRGFGAACNQGARVGSAPFVLFLNPDAAVAPGAVDRAVEFLNSPGGRTVGVCGARVFNAAGHPAIAGGPFPTPRLIAGQVTGLSRVLPSLFPSKRVTALTDTGPMDHVIGAFFLVRRAVLDALGGFDEGFFMYYEEVDLCLRARQRGWSTFHLAEVEVTHAENVSTDQVRAERLAYSLTSRDRYARKHWSGRANAILMATTFLIEFPARLAAEALRGRRAPSETMRGFRLFVTTQGKRQPGLTPIRRPLSSMRMSKGTSSRPAKNSSVALRAPPHQP